MLVHGQLLFVFLLYDVITEHLFDNRLVVLQEWLRYPEVLRPVLALKARYIPHTFKAKERMLNYFSLTHRDKEAFKK
jgi:hypothetical protein